MKLSIKQTIFNWITAITVLVFWSFIAGVMDEQKRIADEAFRRQGEMMQRSAKIAAAFTMCKSENATPVWKSNTEVECLTTKGRPASRQVVAVNP